MVSHNQNNAFLKIILTYLLHLRTTTIMIAPNSADIIDTIINVKAHPNSAAASEKQKKINFYLLFRFNLVYMHSIYNHDYA